MFVCVTGGTGYIGSVLLPQLVRRGFLVDYFDLKPPVPQLVSQLPPNRAKFISMDVADQEKFREYAPQYDVFIHLAALVGYPACNREPEMAVRSNVETTQSILSTKRKSARVLYTSTISNYGTQSGPVDENTIATPNSVYGETKKKAEDLVLSQPQNIVFRYAGAFGLSLNMRTDNLIHDFARRAATGERLSVYESHFIRQFIHVNDMVAAILHALDNWNALQGNIFNVGNPAIEITKKDLVERMARFCSFEYAFENSGSDAEKRNYPISFQKFINTGFTPRQTLDTALPELIEYFATQKMLQQELAYDRKIALSA